MDRIADSLLGAGLANRRVITALDLELFTLSTRLRSPSY